jgi:ADP-ribosyl-[dinitrogen reductase] hydrolase
MLLEQVKSGILGLAVGDALGVPVEFYGRETLKNRPVVDMRAYGAHHQPKGTWSDDSSLAFCLAESLIKGYDLQDLANRFINWYQKGYWTPHGKVFDIGIATSFAIRRLIDEYPPVMAGGASEDSNGNGSLMRILPLVFFIKDKPIGERFKIIQDVSSLTHRHIRSVIACFYYTEFARLLLEGKEKYTVFEETKEVVNAFLKNNDLIPAKEIEKFHRLLVNPMTDFEVQPIYTYSENKINSSGYVLSTLEASIWCLLNSNSYAETVLKAVNLGDDTDTTGAVAGGLAGLLYGFDAIPAQWVYDLVKSDEVIDLAERLYDKMSTPSVF